MNRFLLAALGLFVVGGCGEPAPVSATLAASADSTSLPPDEINDAGHVLLGSASLTAGIPGEGPLKLREVERWLGDPRNHEEFTAALPAHLGGGAVEKSFTRAKIELGRQLFFDSRLSGSGGMSCGDCHHPKKSYTNFIGRYGELRDPLPAFNRVLGKTHFWDGKAESLEQQVRFPIENKLEMRTSPERVVEVVESIPGYRLQFERIYGGVTFDALAQAIATFERTIVTGPSEYDRGELSDAAERGKELFFSERTRCSLCHRGANFSDESFHNIGSAKSDPGRFAVTNVEADWGAFKTPTLRNIARTGPYFHDARFESLAEVVAYKTRGGETSPRGQNELLPLGLSSDEHSDLVEFLESLAGELPPVETERLPE